MSILGFRARNHPQQVFTRGQLDDVDDRAVHPSHFLGFCERFGDFTLDVAAAAHNTKCERRPNERPPFGCCLLIFSGGAS